MASRGGARANDGTVSTASLVVGVAATEAARRDVPVGGVAGQHSIPSTSLTTSVVSSDTFA